MKKIEISKTGKHTANNGMVVNFSDDTFNASILAYNPKIHEAPLVVGHPSLTAPAFGWVESIDFADGVLTANPSQVNADFAQMVNDGAFKKVSASFFTPNAANNPVPGVFYLRHVGFLGAAAPAIKGLKDVSFAETEDDCVTIDFSDADNESSSNRFMHALRDFLTTNTQLPSLEFSSPNEHPTNKEIKPMPDKDKDTIDFAEQQKSIDTQTAAIKAREEKLAKQEDKLMRQSHADFAESLVAAGKVLPADKDNLVEFMSSLSSDETIEFSDGDEKSKETRVDWFQGFMKKQPVQVDFSEHSAEGHNDASTVDFAAPNGATVNQAQLEIHQKAVAYQSKHDCDYMTAVTAVGGK